MSVTFFWTLFVGFIGVSSYTLSKWCQGNRYANLIEDLFKSMDSFLSDRTSDKTDSAAYILQKIYGTCVDMENIHSNVNFSRMLWYVKIQFVHLKIRTDDDDYEIIDNFCKVVISTLISQYKSNTGIDFDEVNSGYDNDTSNSDSNSDSDSDSDSASESASYNDFEDEDNANRNANRLTQRRVPIVSPPLTSTPVPLETCSNQKCGSTQ